MESNSVSPAPLASALQIGAPAPDAQLVDTEGQAITLSSLWQQGRPLVLVFLRHLGCTFCRQQLANLANDHARFVAAGANVACVAQGTPSVGKAYTILYQLPFPLLLCGDDLSIYRDYGLSRGTRRQLLSPIVLLRGFASVFQGHKQTQVVGDGHQLGGAFIIDITGTMRHIHRNADYSDNARNPALLEALTILFK